MVVVDDEVAGEAQAQHRGHVHAAREDRRVRGRAPEVDAEADGRAQRQHVGRRDVLGHEDGLLRHRRRTRARSGQHAHDALGDLLHVAPALAQVGILEGLELGRQMPGLRRECPLGVPQVVADRLVRGLGERRVVEDHAVHVEQRARLGRALGGQLLGQLEQLGLHHLDRGLEPRLLAHHLRRLQPVVRHVAVARLEHARAPDHDAAADPRAVKTEHRASVSGRPSPHGRRGQVRACCGPARSSSRYSWARRARAAPPSSSRSSTRRILPEMVLGSSANSRRRTRW